MGKKRQSLGAQNKQQSRETAAPAVESQVSDGFRLFPSSSSSSSISLEGSLKGKAIDSHLQPMHDSGHVFNDPSQLSDPVSSSSLPSAIPSSSSSSSQVALASDQASFLKLLKDLQVNVDRVAAQVTTFHEKIKAKELPTDQGVSYLEVALPPSLLSA